MRPRKLVPVIAAALLLAGLPLAGAPVPAAAADSFSFAVIGDVPYGSAQIAAFPRQIDQINADPTVQLATISATSATPSTAPIRTTRRSRRSSTVSSTPSSTLLATTNGPIATARPWARPTPWNG